MSGAGFLATSRAFMISTKSGNVYVAYGTHTSVAASDAVSTGLTKVLWAAAQLEDSPVIGADRALAFIGDQAGTPAKGSISIKTFMPTTTTDTTPIAATTFSKKVNWIAIGEM